MSDLLSSAFANFVGNRKSSIAVQQQQHQLVPPPVLSLSDQPPPSSLTYPSISTTQPPAKRMRYTVSIPLPLSSPVSIHSPYSVYNSSSAPPSPPTSLISQPAIDPSSYSFTTHPVLSQSVNNSVNSRNRRHDLINYTNIQLPQTYSQYPSPASIDTFETIPNQNITQPVTYNSVVKSSIPTKNIQPVVITTVSITNNNKQQSSENNTIIDKRIPCPHCNDVLSSEKALQQHKMKSHERPFGCKITGCYASFSKQNHLSRHIRIVHNKERPFACTEPGCGSRFGSKSHLGDHTRAVHMRLRNFKCNICNASWSKRFNLEKHYRIRHLGEKPFKCGLCQLSFGTRSHVTRHEIKVHKKEVNIITK